MFYSQECWIFFFFFFFMKTKNQSFKNVKKKTSRDWKGENLQVQF